MTIQNALDKKAPGLYYGNRILLPFKCHLLKVIIDRDIITDFSPSSKGIFIEENESFMSLYFYDYSSLKDKVTKYETIKMVTVEKSEDIFNLKNHLKLVLYLRDEHKVEIQKTDDDILFLE
ncbi:MAG: hypothetical protein AUK34_14435 [Ignavibacteria bacterium CG2_30_36_16]|nr:hypothetical protein [Ignavibacteria bacterium]OIP54835.1 MAG: hypothetical protein AUK34_14435 [Ignavibacteria bacterium CG2_30_36_16]